MIDPPAYTTSSSQLSFAPMTLASLVASVFADQLKRHPHNIVQSRASRLSHLLEEAVQLFEETVEAEGSNFEPFTGVDSPLKQ